jgi:hypothetical protein
MGNLMIELCVMRADFVLNGLSVQVRHARESSPWGHASLGRWVSDPSLESENHDKKPRLNEAHS